MRRKTGPKGKAKSSRGRASWLIPLKFPAYRMRPRLLPRQPLRSQKPKEKRWPNPALGIGRTMTFWSISRKRSPRLTKRTATSCPPFTVWRFWPNRPKRSFFDPWPLVTTATSCAFPPRSGGQHRVPNRYRVAVGEQHCCHSPTRAPVIYSAQWTHLESRSRT